LSRTKVDLRSDAWHRAAEGKGVLLLHKLRELLGHKAFDDALDDFGLANAGKPVATADFRAAIEKAAGKKLKDIFDPWLDETGMPDDQPSAFSVLTFQEEQEQTLIVYGTGIEGNINREAAEALQQAVRARHSNYTIPIKSDQDHPRTICETITLS